MLAAACLVLLGAGGVARLADPVANLPAMLAWVAVSTAGWALGWRAAAGGAPPSVTTVLVVGALARILLVAPAVPLSDDLYRYLWDGRVGNAGINPFLWPPSADEVAPLRDDVIWPRINHPGVATIYPPFAQLSFGCLDAISGDPRAPRVFAAACDLLAAVFLALWLKRRGRSPGLAVAYAWCPLVMLETARGGHIDATGVALLLAGFLALQRASSARGAMLAGVLFGLSASVKPAAAVLAPMLLSNALPRRRAILAGAAISLLLWVPYLDAGARITSGFLTYAEHWRFNDALYTPVVDAGAAPRTARYILAGALVMVATVAGRRTRDPGVTAGPLLLALLFLSPTVHPWYGLWVAPFAPLAPRAFAAGIVALCALLPISYVTAHRHVITGVWHEPLWPRAILWSTVVAAVLAGILLEANRRRRVSRVASRTSV